jgi:hypothetical protein
MELGRRPPGYKREKNAERSGVTPFPPLPESVETEITEMLRNGASVPEASKRLYDITGWEGGKCITWTKLCELRVFPPKQYPCPHCGAPLASEAAKQCLSCGMDWHDPNLLVRLGSPSPGATPLT